MRREIAKYVGKEYTDGGDVHWTLKREKMKMIPPPSITGENATDVDNKILNVEVSKYVKRRSRLRSNIEKVYTPILGQCTEITCM